MSTDTIVRSLVRAGSAARRSRSCRRRTGSRQTPWRSAASTSASHLLLARRVARRDPARARRAPYLIAYISSCVWPWPWRRRISASSVSAPSSRNLRTSLEEAGVRARFRGCAAGTPTGSGRADRGAARSCPPSTAGRREARRRRARSGRRTASTLPLGSTPNAVSRKPHTGRLSSASSRGGAGGGTKRSRRRPAARSAPERVDRFGDFSPISPPPSAEIISRRSNGTGATRDFHRWSQLEVGPLSFLAAFFFFSWRRSASSIEWERWMSASCAASFASFW